MFIGWGTGYAREDRISITFVQQTIDLLVALLIHEDLHHMARWTPDNLL
jgi:hypothetical protein